MNLSSTIKLVTSPESVSIVVTKLHDLSMSSLLKLASSYYPEDHPVCRSDYLNWLYEKNPHGSGRLVTAIAEDGTYAGIMGLIPLKIRCGNSVIDANMCVNVLVHPDYRSMRLFDRMISEAKNYLSKKGEWLIGHPNDRAYPGWHRAGMVFGNGYEMLAIRPCYFGLEAGWTEVDILAEYDFEPLIEWQSNLHHPVLATDAQFLRWRFLDHPENHYRLFLKLVGKKVMGYYVIKNFRWPMVRLAIDWQGKSLWMKGPPGSFGITLAAWPIGGEAVMAKRPRRLFKIPCLKKTIKFFATPCGLELKDITSWAFLTLAASDF